MLSADHRQEHQGWHYPTVEFVAGVHEDVIATSGGLPGIRDPNVLASAVEAPFVTAFGEDVHRTLFRKIAAIGYMIAANHPFVDGNKRTALVTVHETLDWNGFALTLGDDEAVAIMIQLATRGFSIGQFRDVLVAGCGIDVRDPLV